MNHYLLPFWLEVDETSTAEESDAGLRFGNVATQRLVRELLALGSRRQDLRGLVFGGACPSTGGHSRRPLGSRNVEVALRVLEAEHIDVVKKEVGGTCGRKVLFLTDEGKTWTRSFS